LWKKTKIKISEESKEEDKNKESEELFSFVLNSGSKSEGDGINTIGIYGDIDEETAATTVYSLMVAAESVPEEVEGEEPIPIKPLKVIVSTHGGVAHEMFAIYDTMNMVKKERDIETMGLGKVMSAGVVILAAGTKGKRKIGRNCRVMIHPVNAASFGDLPDIENEIKEVKWLQKQYVKLLAENTSMSESQIKRLLKKKVNIYFSAEEAVKHGIVDEIV